MRTIILLSLLLSLPLLTEESHHLSGAGTNEALDKLSFSSTQKWDRELQKYTRKTPILLPKNWKQKVAIPQPPANSSRRTEQELHHLKTLSSQRPEYQSQIEAEAILPNFPFAQHTYASLTDATKRPATAKLVEATFQDAAIATFVFKKEFDRVRPSLLANKVDRPIGTAIAIPQHPAYPSGHSTSAWSIAYLLQELDPTNTESYHQSATATAHHREIAGLHYPSDSQAGQLLARQLIDLLLTNPHFQRQLAEAKKEW